MYNKCADSVPFMPEVFTAQVAALGKRLDLKGL